MNRGEGAERDPDVPVYRGVKLTKEQLDELKNLYKNNEPLRLRCYQSTSDDKDVAIGFMLQGLTANRYPLLLQIYGLERENFFALDNADYSLFSYERELLIMDGTPFNILDIQEITHQEQGQDSDEKVIYTLVKLK